MEPQRIDRVLREARTRLPPGEAELLLAHVLGRPVGWLFAHGDDTLEAVRRGAFEALLARRLAGEPVAYLLGTRGFWRFDLEVTPDTLIPRPETERLVELALERLPGNAACRVLDLGTGSGAIALSIAFERPLAAVTATDASEPALDVARRNAARLGLRNVRFAHGDWYAAVDGEPYDAILSNPPYVAEGDPHLQQGDLRFEPLTALACGDDGLAAIRIIAEGAPSRLRAGGWLMIEHGFDQGAAVRGLLHAAGFADVATAQDLEHRDRVTLGRRPPGR